MNTITDIFSVIETPKESCSCKTNTQATSDRNDMIDLVTTPLVLDIYRGQPFKLVLDNVDDGFELSFKCNAFNKKFTYYNSQYILSLSDDETITLTPNTYTYYVYKNNTYWYTGTLNVRDSEYYTDGIGLVKYQLSQVLNDVDKLNDRVAILENIHATPDEVSLLCNEVYNL